MVITSLTCLSSKAGRAWQCYCLSDHGYASADDGDGDDEVGGHGGDDDGEVVS